MRGVLLGSIIERLTSLKDGSIKLTLETQEMTPAKSAELFALRGQLATVYISPAEITTRELEQVDALEPELPGKRPSQRMRNVLYLLWKQNAEGFKEFDAYYLSKMEAYIETLKQNIIP